MMMPRVLILAMAGSLCFGCAGDTGSDEQQVGQPDEQQDESPRVGFEILNVVSPAEVIVWVTASITEAEFDAIEFPADEIWIKNQPREGTADGGAFARSPGAAMDGDYTTAELFGHTWLHNATVVETNIQIDDEGLLQGNRVAKHHEIRFDAGRTLSVLISPDGDEYVLVSRDAGRTTDTPTLPAGWRLVDHVTAQALVFDLPNPTLNLRADNQDSWQGPVAELSHLSDL